ncbi:MAG: hypothetical protein K2J82_09410 [Muribaculaceae bacterium]|nr:hypothetical protein [Muribaculaceae bacterium]MDE6754810.1 hypothetical protein [Muribaculaceae bacterium]
MVWKLLKHSGCSLPQGLEELFEMVRFERTDQSYDIWLDEKKQRSEDICAILISWVSID